MYTQRIYEHKFHTLWHKYIFRFANKCLFFKFWPCCRSNDMVLMSWKLEHLYFTNACYVYVATRKQNSHNISPPKNIASMLHLMAIKLNVRFRSYTLLINSICPHITTRKKSMFVHARDTKMFVVSITKCLLINTVFLPFIGVFSILVVWLCEQYWILHHIKDATERLP